ncbi:hypothetical protein GYMLUDRAFT_258799 [Collybiopsis luxurians FD-317 M1]|nr:hypothetical protein GYMLUDRAFT_258799 [Collybiopsis luxurians FD-317 M1]
MIRSLPTSSPLSLQTKAPSAQQQSTPSYAEYTLCRCLSDLKAARSTNSYVKSSVNSYQGSTIVATKLYIAGFSTQNLTLPFGISIPKKRYSFVWISGRPTYLSVPDLDVLYRFDLTGPPSSTDFGGDLQFQVRMSPLYVLSRGGSTPGDELSKTIAGGCVLYRCGRVDRFAHRRLPTALILSPANSHRLSKLSASTVNPPDLSRSKLLFHTEDSLIRRNECKSIVKSVDAVLDATIRVAARNVTGLEKVLREGHPVLGIAVAELGKFLAVDEPSPCSSGTVPSESAGSSLEGQAPASAQDQDQSPVEAQDRVRGREVYPPSGFLRLKLAYETLLRAREILLVGFGEANGVVEGC